MHRAAIVLTLLGLALAVPARAQMSNEGLPRGACLSAAESRNLFVADKLVQPFKVMRDTARTAQGEAIDIQLCRAQNMLVYDVTLLNPQGRVSHRLVDATNGALLPVPVETEASRAPRPGLQGQRPMENPYPGAEADAYMAPRYRQNFFQGPRAGPFLYLGPRQGGPFFPGMRAGERGP